MPRKTVDEIDLPPLEDLKVAEVEAAPEKERPARRPRAPKPPPPTEWSPRRRNIVYWSIPFVALTGALLLTVIFHRFEAFLITDSRFHLPPPAEYGQDPPTLKLSGVHRAAKSAILKVFE